MSETTPFRSTPPDDGGLDPADRAAMALSKAWASGGPPPDVAGMWAEYAPGGEVEVLSALVKMDLRWRFHLGERPDAAAYLDRFPALREARERVISLVYEEYCLREERGEARDPESFVALYDPWRDSLLSQLRYHRDFSQAVGAVPSSGPPRLSTGARFRTFRLGRVLGEGGSARVYLAHDESLGDRVVALKLSTDRGKEPAIQGRLDHAHIVPVLSVTDDPETGLRGLCMPYRAGRSLDKVIPRINPASRPRAASALAQALSEDDDAKADGPAPAPVRWAGFPSGGTYAQGVAWLVSVVARALAYAHEQGVLHRDVKPANVLLTARVGPQLLDFNLAHSPHAADQAEAALRGGTLPYMAPEQLRAFLDPDCWDDVHRGADIYAAGLVLRELLTGRRPSGPDPDVPLPRAIRDLLDHRAREFRSTRALNPDVPHALDAILARCLAFHPEDRYPGAADLAEDLERFVANRPLIYADNPSWRERSQNWLKRRGRRAAIAGVTAVTLAAAMIVLPRVLSPVVANSLVKAALDSLRAGDLKGAERKLGWAIRLDPRSLHVRRVGAEIYQKGRAPALALVQIDHALAILNGLPSKPQPEETALLYQTKGQILEAFSPPREQEAEAAYAVAIGEAPYFHQSHAALARIKERKKDHLGALRHYDDAVKMHKVFGKAGDRPQLASYLRCRAVIAFHLGDARRFEAGACAEEERARKLDAARTYFDQARRDLATARSLMGGANAAEKNHLAWAEAFGHFVAANLAALPDDHPAAVEEYQAALRLLDALEAIGYFNREMRLIRTAAQARLGHELDQMKGH